MQTNLFTVHRQSLLGFLRTRWRTALLALLLDFIANICLVALSLLLAQTIAVLFGFRSLRGSMFGLQNFQAYQLLGCFMGAVLVKFAIDIARLWCRGQLTEDLAHHLRLLIFERHLNTDVQRAESRDMGRNLLRFSGDLGSVQRLLGQGMLQGTADFGLLLIGFGLIAWFDIGLALWVAGGVLTAFGLTRVLDRRMRRVEARRRNKRAGLLALVNNTLLHLSAIQALNRSTRVTQRFERSALQVRNCGHRYGRLAALQGAMPSFFAHALLLGVLYFGWAVGFSAPSLFAVVLVLLSWRGPLTRLLRIGLIWERGLLSLEKIESILQTPISSEGKVALNKKHVKTLQLCGVNFGFGSKSVLENLTFRLEIGQIRQLILPVGGGKTTLVKLLAGLYRPNSGSIEWEGEPGQHLTLRSVRQQAAFVSEAFPLTGRTLLDALSASGRRSALIETAGALSRFQELFPTILHGIDVHQQMNGPARVLSAGQHRLLQCLRAILADKPFLILDEPFMGLDAETACKLAHYLQENSASRGVLLLTSQPVGALAGFSFDERYDVSMLLPR